jgi:hypothetical protein
MTEMMDDSQNESNLVQRREDRRTLEKMRRKLATSGTVSKKSNLPHQAKKPGLRIWPFAVAAAVLLIALNFGLSTQENKILKAMGVSVPGQNTLTPPPGLSLDEKVRFWAYAVYDVPKLRARFAIPKGTKVDSKAARKELEQMLAEDLGAEVRNEIFILQQKDPQPKIPAQKPKAIAKPR